MLHPSSKNPMARHLYMVGTVHTDPDGPRRLSRAYKTLGKPGQITVEAEEGDNPQWFTPAEADLFLSICQGLRFTIGNNEYVLDSDRIAQFEAFKDFYGYELMVAQALNRRGLAKVHLVDSDPNVSNNQPVSLVHRLEQIPYEFRQMPFRVKQFLHSRIRPYTVDRDVLIREFETMCESWDMSARAFDIEEVIDQHLVKKLCREQRYANFDEREVRLNRMREFAEYAALTFFSVRERSLIVEDNYYRYDPMNSRDDLTERVVQRDEHMARRIRDVWETTEGGVLHVGGAYHMFGDYHNLFERLRDLKPTRYNLCEFNIDDWDKKLAEKGKQFKAQ